MSGNLTPYQKFTKGAYDVSLYDSQDNPLTATLSTTATRVLQQNPNRVSIKFVNPSSITAYVWTDNTVSSSKGFVVNPNGGFITLSVRGDDSLDLINEWWGISASGNGNAFVSRQIFKVA